MDEPLNKDEDFLVKDSIVISLIIGGAFFAMFISAIIYNSKSSYFERIILFSLIPAALFIFRVFNRKPVIIINKNGIFYLGAMITDWAHFYHAEAVQLPLKIGGFSDRVILRVQYCKDEDDLYKQELPLANTQNKSEEQIISAIEFYYEFYKNAMASTIS